MVGLTAFLAWLLGGLALLDYRRHRESAVDLWRRAVGLEDDDWLTGPAVSAERLAARLARRPPEGSRLRRLLYFVGERGGVRARAEDLGRYERLLYQAGQPYGLTPDEVAAAKVVGAVGLPVVLWVLTGLQLSTIGLALLTVGALVGYRFPEIWLQSRAKVRRKQMARELINFVDLLTLTAEVKGNLESSIDYVASRMPGLLPREFQRATRTVQYGGSFEEALSRLADLIELEDVQLLCHALLQGRRLGVPVARTLREQSQTLKQRRVDRAEAEAGKASVRLLLPLIVCFFPPILVVALGPTMRQFLVVIGG